MGTLFSGTEGTAQVRRSPDVAAANPDTVRVSAADSAGVARRGDIETTINYKAKDSIRYDAANQIMYLYGDAHIDYGEISLDAAFIEINWRTAILTADGVVDSIGALTKK